MTVPGVELEGHSRIHYTSRQRSLCVLRCFLSVHGDIQSQAFDLKTIKKKISVSI